MFSPTRENGCQLVLIGANLAHYRPLAARPNSSSGTTSTPPAYSIGDRGSGITACLESEIG